MLIEELNNAFIQIFTWQHNDQKKKYKQRSTKHSHKTTDRVTRTPLKPRMNSLPMQKRIGALYLLRYEEAYSASLCLYDDIGGWLAIYRWFS